MTSKIKYILMISLALISCDFRKSINKDLTTGLITKGNGLSCEEVWLSVDEEKIERNTFIYGEIFVMHFNDMEGFRKEEKCVFPGMIMSVTDEAGDTIFQTEDLYSNYLNGMSESPLLLKTSLTLGTPMHSNRNYTVFIKIWDKKNTGTFTAEMPFSIIQNEKISIEKSNISYDEIYLYSADRDRAITDGVAGFNENIYLIYEGLTGVTEENEMVFPGFKLLATDHSQNVILDYPDSFESYAETGINSFDFKTQFYVTIKFTQRQVENPIHCETILFDKKSSSKLKVSTDLILK